MIKITGILIILSLLLTLLSYVIEVSSIYLIFIYILWTIVGLLITYIFLSAIFGKNKGGE